MDVSRLNDGTPKPGDQALNRTRPAGDLQNKEVERTLMVNKKQHIVILPYYCEDEVQRYLKIADFLKSQPKSKTEHCFLLAASPLATTSDELLNAYSQLAPTYHFKCPSQVFGYPEGPTAMFWDCMDHIGEKFKGCQGFGLWMESDMCPTRGDWIDRLSAEWFGAATEPIMMGCYVPKVYKYRLLRKPKLILDPHINGGACYSIGFASQMPAEAREGVFDMAVYKFANKAGRILPTKQITFSTLNRVRRDLRDETKTVLHGFMQDKNRFIADCVRPISGRERKTAMLAPVQESLETIGRRLRVCFVRRGHKAMLENMLLAKQRLESKKRVA